MLPAPQRLSQARDIGRVLRLGRPVKGGFIRVKFSRNNQKHFRWAFVVSNKVSKKATVRNQIRRRLRAIIFSHLRDFQSKPNCDVMVFASPNAVGRDFRAIQNELELVLRRARLLNG